MKMLPVYCVEHLISTYERGGFTVLLNVETLLRCNAAWSDADNWDPEWSRVFYLFLLFIFLKRNGFRRFFTRALLALVSSILVLGGVRAKRAGHPVIRAVILNRSSGHPKNHLNRSSGHPNSTQSVIRSSKYITSGTGTVTKTEHFQPIPTGYYLSNMVKSLENMKTYAPPPNCVLKYLV